MKFNYSILRINGSFASHTLHPMYFDFHSCTFSVPCNLVEKLAELRTGSGSHHFRVGARRVLAAAETDSRHQRRVTSSQQTDWLLLLLLLLTAVTPTTSHGSVSSSFTQARHDGRYSHHDSLSSYSPTMTDSVIFTLAHMFNDRRRIEVPPTAFRTETIILTLTLTSDLDLQSHENYGHDPYMCKRSRSKVTRFES